MLPPLERLTSRKRIMVYNIILFGAPQLGKTELAKWIVSKAMDRYGIKNVNAVITSNGEIRPLIDGLFNKIVNILIADDLTLQEVDKEDIKDFFKVAHKARENGMDRGLIFTIQILHDFYSLKKSLRTTFDYLFLCSVPTNKYDFNQFRGYFPDDILSKMVEIQGNKRWDDDKLSIKAYWSLGNVGLIRAEKTNVRIRPISERPTIANTLRNMKIAMRKSTLEDKDRDRMGKKRVERPPTNMNIGTEEGEEGEDEQQALDMDADALDE